MPDGSGNGKQEVWSPCGVLSCAAEIFVRVNRGFGASLGACPCALSDRWLFRFGGWLRRAGGFRGAGVLGVGRRVRLGARGPCVCVGVFAWRGWLCPVGRGLLLCMAGARAKQGHSVDALAPGGDEGRGTLRKATGSREQALIRGYPNGATHPYGVVPAESIGRRGKPGELKHLSTRRKRHQTRFRE